MKSTELANRGGDGFRKQTGNEALKKALKHIGATPANTQFILPIGMIMRGKFDPVQAAVFALDMRLLFVINAESDKEATDFAHLDEVERAFLKRISKPVEKWG